MHNPPKYETYLAGGVMTGTTALGGTALDMLGYTMALFRLEWTSTAIGVVSVACSNTGSAVAAEWTTMNVIVPLHPSGAAGNCVIRVPAIARYVKLTYTNVSSTGVLGVTVLKSAEPVSTEVSRVLLPATVVNGGNATILSASATQLTATSTPLQSGVTVKSLAANTGKIYVGNSTVTATGATQGFELSPGQEKFFEIDNVNKLYAIAIVNNEDVCWGGS